MQSSGPLWAAQVLHALRLTNEFSQALRRDRSDRESILRQVPSSSGLSGSRLGNSGCPQDLAKDRNSLQETAGGPVTIAHERVETGSRAAAQD
jgi:hypothetical protein